VALFVAVIGRVGERNKNSSNTEKAGGKFVCLAGRLEGGTVSYSLFSLSFSLWEKKRKGEGGGNISPFPFSRKKKGKIGRPPPFSVLRKKEEGRRGKLLPPEKKKEEEPRLSSFFPFCFGGRKKRGKTLRPGKKREGEGGRGPLSFLFDNGKRRRKKSKKKGGTATQLHPPARGPKKKGGNGFIWFDEGE